MKPHEAADSQTVDLNQLPEFFQTYSSGHGHRHAFQKRLGGLIRHQRHFHQRRHKRYLKHHLKAYHRRQEN